MIKTQLRTIFSKTLLLANVVSLCFSFYLVSYIVIGKLKNVAIFSLAHSYKNFYDVQ